MPYTLENLQEETVCKGKIKCFRYDTGVLQDTLDYLMGVRIVEITRRCGHQEKARIEFDPGREVLQVKLEEEVLCFDCCRHILPVE